MIILTNHNKIKFNMFKLIYNYQFVNNIILSVNSSTEEQNQINYLHSRSIIVSVPSDFSFKKILLLFK